MRIGNVGHKSKNGQETGCNSHAAEGIASTLTGTPPRQIGIVFGGKGADMFKHLWISFLNY